MRTLYFLILTAVATAAFATQDHAVADIGQTEYDFAYTAPLGVGDDS